MGLETAAFMANPWAMGITSGVGLLGSLYGQYQSAKIGRKNDRMLDSRMNDLSAWYKNNYYKDFLQTDLAKSILSRFNTYFLDQSNILNNISAKTGATHEANVAGKSKLNKTYAEALAQLLGMGTQYKDNIQNRYDSRMDNLYNMKYMNNQQKQQGWSNFGSNVTSSLGNLYSAFQGGTPTTGVTKNLNVNGYGMRDGYGVNRPFTGTLGIFN